MQVNSRTSACTQAIAVVAGRLAGVRGRGRLRRRPLPSLAWLLCLSLVVLDAAAAEPNGDWTMPAHDYASTRFSPLGEINRGNVRALKVAFTFSTGINRGQDAAPIVVGNTMYIVTPFPNVLYALDLTKPGAPV